MSDPKLSGESLNATEHASILKCLADETRIRLLRLLAREEVNVQELCEITELPQPTISRHLSILRKTELAMDRREGNKMYYSYLPQGGRSSALNDYLAILCETEHDDIDKLDQVLRRRTAVTDNVMSRYGDEWENIIAKLYHPAASAVALAGLSPKDMTVADMGCGTGSLLPVLSGLGGRILAVDRNAEMLDRARTKALELKLKNISFVRADLENLSATSFPDMDAVMLHYVMHQIASPPTLLKSIASMLKPHGRIVITDRTPHDDEDSRKKYGSLWLGFEKEKLQQMLNEAGMEVFSYHVLQKDSCAGETSFVCTAIRKEV